ncbi:MAG: hypothetical protein D6681_19865 [Calditrichaeota bacterium]|nr:MAG: hypothetical protein D6681_19865 [Calditrichota bacterium]
MKFIETAVIAQHPRDLEALMGFLEADRETVAGVEVYRFEIDTDLIALLYDFHPEKALPEAVLEHLNPHLEALLLMVQKPFEETDRELAAHMNRIASTFSHLPTIMAVRITPESLAALPAPIREQGLFLSSRGRMMFWHPSDRDSQARIWEMLWHQLPRHQS